MQEEKMKYFENAISWLSGKAYSELKSIHEDHDDPKTFSNQSTGAIVQPDMSFKLKNGAKYFIDISIKTDQVQKLVTKWKLLSLMASVKRGKLFLLAPKGHKMFTQKLVNDYNINAIVYSL